jgi:hypothetical protein
MLKWLPWILRMDRHGIKPPRRKTPVRKNRALCKLGSPKLNKSTKAKSNLFDSILNYEEECKLKESNATMNGANDPLTTNCHLNALTVDNINTTHCNHLCREQIYQHNNHLLSDNDRLSFDFSDESLSQSYANSNLQCRKSKEILSEMRFITNRIRRNDEIRESINEWKFAAAVIDRLCLILFSLFTVISTAMCLLSAPQLIV